MLAELLDRHGFSSPADLAGPGRFEGESPITLYLWDRWLDGDAGDDWVDFGNCDGVNRYGRRILRMTSTGFVFSDRMDSVADAIAAMANYHHMYDDDDDELFTVVSVMEYDTETDTLR